MAKDKPICTIPDCNKPVAAKSLCWKHYERLRKFGDPLACKTAGDGDGLAFLKWANAVNASHCILWPYGTQKDGYGALRVNGSMVLAHRHSLTLALGEPESADLHAAHCPYRCLHKSCVNPNHLRWATKSENELDKALAYVRDV